MEFLYGEDAIIKLKWPCDSHFMQWYDLSMEAKIGNMNPWNFSLSSIADGLVHVYVIHSRWS